MAVEIRTRPLPVTYATARLQTLVGGAPGLAVDGEEGARPRVEQHFGRQGEKWVPKPPSIEARLIPWSGPVRTLTVGKMTPLYGGRAERDRLSIPRPSG
jgi:hypothetical protein